MFTFTGGGGVEGPDLQYTQLCAFYFWKNANTFIILLKYILNSATEYFYIAIDTFK